MIMIPTINDVIVIDFVPMGMKNPRTAAANTSLEISARYLETASI